jgi:uncharacterized membrane protein
MNLAPLTSALDTLFTLVSHLSPAAEQREQLYDHALLSDSERDAWRTALRAAKNEEEHERLHEAHRALLEARAATTAREKRA